MTPNNNLSVLPWYTDINFQNHRKWYSFGDIYPLFTPNRTMLPFQIIRPTRNNQITNVTMYRKGGEYVGIITQHLKETGLQIKQFASLGYDVIVYPGILPMQLTTKEGIYYCTMTDGVQTWYSEMFTLVNDVSGYTKIQWYDAENMFFDDGAIVYEGVPFKNTLYLCTTIGKPEYQFVEEGEDRDGYFFPEKQISEKTYKFMFLAPEYLCDAMRIIRMSDYVMIESMGQKYDCDTFLITPKWQTQGNLASVETEFECATVIKKIGRGVIPTTLGDYNADYNEDFNI